MNFVKVSYIYIHIYICTGGAKNVYTFQEIETAWAAIHVDTLVNVAAAVVRRNQKCLDGDGNHFEHLL